MRKSDLEALKDFIRSRVDEQVQHRVRLLSVGDIAETIAENLRTEALVKEYIIPAFWERFRGLEERLLAMVGSKQELEDRAKFRKEIKRLQEEICEIKKVVGMEIIGEGEK